MNEKPSEWVERRAKELYHRVVDAAERDPTGSVSVTALPMAHIVAIVEYLDRQHATKFDAEKRYVETEPELPY